MTRRAAKGREALRLVPVLVLVTASLVRAEFPYPPNPRPCDDGEPPDCIEPREFHRYLFLPEADPPLRPDDFGSDNWKLTSARTGEPEIDENPQELFGVKGASVDLAWQVTTGRPDVLIAVLDSGIRWAEADQIADLVDKIHLNPGELPPPQTDASDAPGPHDRNGDGVFNMADYRGEGDWPGDPRVVDANGNGILDPEDLIFAFSDGVDDDGNGFTDDISGWDFWEDDNDPLDEVAFGHGTGEARDSAAEADNGVGGVGSCPNCMILPVRVGDSFVVEVNRFAQGVLFAVDSGASVIQEALGSLNHSEFGQRAIDYAYRNGVVVIASAADEQSRHNNYPANYAHTVEVNSVRRFFSEGGLEQSPRSYLYLNGCTNYGGHIAFSVPSSACSSEATGIGAGIAGLLVSAALDARARGVLSSYRHDDGSEAPFVLSAEEIKQILTATADDINFDARPELDPPLPANYETRIPVPGVGTSRRFPSIAGWDQYFGYGRVNAAAAVRAVRDGAIPPEAAIEHPRWFAPLDPRTGDLPLNGRVAANRAASYRYVVEVGPGVQPRDEEFVEVFRSAEHARPVTGELAVLDLGLVAAMLPGGVTGPPVQDDGSGRGDPERFAFTVRVRVTDNRGLRGEDRRTLFLHEDPQLAPGYPLFLGADGASPPTAADIDADGVEELIVATSNGEIHAFRADGSELPGWPVFTDPIEAHVDSPAFATGGITVPRGAILGTVAVGDVDGDGRLEVAAADVEGKLYLWSAAGRRLPGFPVQTDPAYSHTRRSERDPATAEGLVPDRVNRRDRHNRLGRGFVSGVTLVDLDGDPSTLEIVAPALDRHVYAWHADGRPVSGWPVLVRDPARVAAVDPRTGDITPSPGARAALGSKLTRPASVGDLDGDGAPEVVVTANEEYREPLNAAFDDVLLNLLLASGVVESGNTRVYAIRREGAGESAAAGWNPQAFLPGWPVATGMLVTELLPFVGTGSNGAPALADIDGDGDVEVATFSAVGPLYVLDGDGTSVLGNWPDGPPRTFAVRPTGGAGNSPDVPLMPGLGGAILLPVGGGVGAFRVAAPTAGLGRLLDANLPAMQIPADDQITVWDETGAIVSGFPRQMNDMQFFSAPTAADVDGDGEPELLQGSGGWELHAVSLEGKEAAGWPKFTGGWSVSPPAAADLDGDGRLEIAHVTREGYLFVWHTDAPECGPRPWPLFQHDAWNTGNAETDATPPGSPGGVRFDSTVPALRLRLERMPGDDLYCGDTADFDVRWSEVPVTEESFAGARRVAQVRALAAPGRQGGVLELEDPEVSSVLEAGKPVYLALVARDDAGLRGPFTTAGVIEPAPTPTATQAPSPSPSPSPTATSSPPATPVETVPHVGDDGCRIGGADHGGAHLPLLLGGIFLALAMYRPGSQSRRSRDA